LQCKVTKYLGSGIIEIYFSKESLSTLKAVEKMLKTEKSSSSKNVGEIETLHLYSVSSPILLIEPERK